MTEEKDNIPLKSFSNSTWNCPIKNDTMNKK
jgi:hypothetical protein